MRWPRSAASARRRRPKWSARWRCGAHDSNRIHHKHTKKEKNYFSAFFFVVLCVLCVFVVNNLMDHFKYRDHILHCENVPVRTLAETYGTPLYVYSKATLLHHLRQIQTAFAEVTLLICYSIKTTGNIHLCKVMAVAGSGVDVTSAGKLYRAVTGGVHGAHTV